MSKKEIYAWASFGSSVAILGYYLITVFGWPESVPDVSENLKSLFIRIFIMAFVVELVLDILRSINKDEIYADERDYKMEARGNRNAYYFLVVAIFFITGHEVVDEFLGIVDSSVLGNTPFLTVHMLLVTVFTGMIIKSGTQLFYYMKG